MSSDLTVRLLAVAWLLFCSTAGAAEIPWKKQPFVYEARQKKLPDFLRELASSQGLAVSIDAGIDGEVTAHFRTTPAEALKLVAATYDLTYYYDGVTLYFYKASTMQSRLLRPSVGVQRLQSTLERLRIADTRFPLYSDEREGTVLVTGPKRYVDLVEETSRLLDQRGAPATAPPASAGGAVELRVFPLRYAWAQDKSLNGGSSEVVVPGVASTLRSLFKGGSRAQQPRTASPERMKALSAGKSVTSALLGTFEVPPDLDAAVKQYDDERRRTGGPDDDLPQIQADGRMNSIIVRDYSSRMPAYEKLVRTLDVKPGLVEIEACIFDVTADVVEQLGVTWQGESSRLNGSFNGSSGSGASTPSPGGLITNLAPGVDLASTLLRGVGRSLIVTINALEQQGKARVVSQPKVLTIDNVEAVLSDMQTYHVRVAGNLSAELFNVTAGTKLRVTPLTVVGDDGKRHVKLAIHAEDGALSSVLVDQLPVVQTRNIDTQAIVREGESLLIGGLVYEQDATMQAGVPVLSSIPVVGGLFRHKDMRRIRVERLYLITPRIVAE